LALDGDGWSASSTGCCTPEIRASGTHCKGGWVGPRAGLDAVARRKNPIIAPAGNWTPVVQPVF